MILDSGIATVFEKHDSAPPGGMPVISYTRKCAGWYGVRSFSSRPAWLREMKEDVSVALSIRMHQDLTITNRDAVILMDAQAIPASATVYQVVRVWQGADEVGMPITDIDLEVVEA